MLLHVAYPPDRSRTVVSHEQRSILADGDTHGTSPDVAALGYEAGQEVFVFACGMPILERHADHFVTGALLAVPRTVLRGEDVAVVFGGKLVALVEGHL